MWSFNRLSIRGRSSRQSRRRHSVIALAKFILAFDRAGHAAKSSRAGIRIAVGDFRNEAAARSMAAITAALRQSVELPPDIPATSDRTGVRSGCSGATTSCAMTS